MIKNVEIFVLEKRSCVEMGIDSGLLQTAIKSYGDSEHLGQHFLTVSQPSILE